MILPHDEAGTGDAVILLHAGIADRAMWAEHLPRLAAAGLRAVALDLPGFGDAPVATDEQAPWVDVLATMDALGIDRATLVGSSFGGAVALRVALVAPDRIRGLALVSAPAPGVGESGELLAAWEAEEGRAGARRHRRCRRSGPRRMAAARRGARAARAHRALAAPRARRPGGRRRGSRGAGSARRPGEARRHHVPALVLAGEHDMPDFHGSADVLGRHLSCDDVITIAGAGHLAHSSDPTRSSQSSSGSSPTDAAAARAEFALAEPVWPVA